MTGGRPMDLGSCCAIPQTDDWSISPGPLVRAAPLIDPRLFDAKLLINHATPGVNNGPRQALVIDIGQATHWVPGADVSGACAPTPGANGVISRVRLRLDEQSRDARMLSAYLSLDRNDALLDVVGALV